MKRHFSFKPPSGFTLVELLVVIAIIGTLVALLLPAVQGARESARRMSCTNNIHNLAIAIHNYHDALGTYPSSHFYSVAPNDSVCQGNSTSCEQWGWGVLILPYIEQTNLHTNLSVLSYSLHHTLAGANPGLRDPRQLLQLKLPLFLCPSDSNPDGYVNSTRHFGGGQGTAAGGWGNFHPSVSNYMCSRGTDYRAPSPANGRPTPDTWGLFMETSSKKMSDVFDGTSNTIMLGERDTQICHSGTWIGVRNPAGTGGQGFYVVTATVHARLNAPDPPITYSTVLGCGAGFSSLHVGGANFALADGSVRYINNNIDFTPDTGPLHDYDAHLPRDQKYNVQQSPGKVYSVYSRLGRRNDGFPLGDF
jgi:prepilin-type N-terminal cleavage/methylation domain-containing protein/prepilin-type processing-associated H-X9-DG protein